MSEDRPSIPESVATIERKIFVPAPSVESVHPTPHYQEPTTSPEPKNAQPGIGFLQEIGLVRPDVAQIDPERESVLTSKGAREQEAFIGKRPDAGIKPPTAEQVAEFEQALVTKEFRGMEVLGETTSGDIRALDLKDPKTGKTIIWRLQQTEGSVAAGQVTEFPPGLNLDALRTHVRGLIEAGELDPLGIDPDQIASINNRIDGYAVAGGGSIREKRRLKLEVESRLNLAAANFWIANQGVAEEFAKYFNQMNAERLNMIRDEVLGASGLATIHQMEQRAVNPVTGVADPVGPGSFFRLTGQEYYDQENTYIVAIDAIDHQGIEAAETKFNIIKTLFNTSGMTSYYTGPLDSDPASPTFGQLLEPHFLAAAAQVTQIVAGGRSTYNIINPPQVTNAVINPENLRSDPGLIYQRNETLWTMKRLIRLVEQQAGRQIRFAPGGETVPALRRIFYLPEEFTRRLLAGETTGKAQSLFYATELYVLPLPMMQGGVTTLEDFLGPLNVQAINPRDPGTFTPNAFSESLVKKDRTFRYGNMVKGAAPLFNEMLVFLNEPVKGGSTTSNERLGDDLGNLTKVVDEMGKYLSSFYPNIMHFSTSRLLIGMIDYIQGNSADRWREFRKSARFKLQTMNAIINWSHFKPYMTDLWRRQTLSSVGASGVTASDTTVQNIETGQATISTASPILEALFKAITRK